MKPLFAVIKKELKNYINHPMAYFLAIVFLVLNIFLYFWLGVTQEVASLRRMFDLLPWINVFFISALTMRAWAEERKENTLDVLLSYPVKVWQLVLGKYLATVVFVEVVLLITLIIPISLNGVGRFDWGIILAQYIGASLIAIAMIGIGQWASSLTKNQVIAFIISGSIQFALFLIGLEFVVLAVPYPFNIIGQQLGMLGHYQSLNRGLLDGRDILYFLSVAFVFLTLSYAWLVMIKSNKKSAQWKTLQTSTVIIVIIAVVINLFGQSFTVRWDLTDQNIYSLSSATKTVLRDLNDTVRFTLFRSKKLPTQVELASRDIQDMLQDYKKYGGGNVSLQIKYPDADEEALEDAQQKGIPSIRFNVIREDEFTLQEGYLGLVIEYLDKRETQPVLQDISDLEYRLTSAIIRMERDKKKKIGYISDFGGKDIASWSLFNEVLRENSTVEVVQLTQNSLDEEGQEVESDFAPQIDEDLDVLVVAAPTNKFSDEAIQVLEDYSNNGGKILWFVSGVNVNLETLNVNKVTTGLERIFSERGITINKDLVGDLAANETVNFSNGGRTFFLPYPFWIQAALSKHVLAGNVQQVVMPWPSSIGYEDGAADIGTLISTTEMGVAQTSNFKINPDSFPDFNAMETQSYVLAVTVENIVSDESSEDADAGRWVIIADNSFLDDNIANQNPANLALSLNAIDWLSQNEALLSIRSKNAVPPALIWKSDNQKKVIKWGNLLGTPIAVAVAGYLWLLLRRRKIKNALLDD